MDKKLKQAVLIAALGFAFFGVLIGAALFAQRVDFSAPEKGARLALAGLALLGFFLLNLLVSAIKELRGVEKGGEEDGQTRVLKRRGALVLLFASLLALFAFSLGLLVQKPQLILPRFVYLLLFALAALLPVFIAVMGYSAGKRFADMLKEFYSEDFQRVFWEQREQAEEAAKKTEAQLAVNRQNAGVTAFMLALSGCVCAFTAGLLGFSPPLTALVLIPAALLAAAALNRIRLPIPAAFMEDDESYVSRADFPKLYELAERAAEQVGAGVKSGLKLAVLPNGNIGIGDFDGNISLQIGAQLLSVLSEEELLAILRHEFSHVRSNEGNKIMQYERWMALGRSIFPLSGILDRLFFTREDSEGAFLTVLHGFGNSVRDEEAADRAMLTGCDKRVAASALIKTGFLASFEYERNSYDTPSDFDGESVPDDLASKQNRELIERIALRKKAWLSMIPLEILSRSASHPTLKMRLEHFGVSKYEALEAEDSAELAAEKRRALEFSDAFYKKRLAEAYKSARKSALETLSEWEGAGRPLTAEGYADVIGALSDMGRVSEAEALADRAIAELPEAGRAYACLFKGELLAKRCDRAALPLLYEAIKTDNYVEQGLEYIGTLCCLIGDAEELEKYRALAPELQREHYGDQSKVGYISAKDELSEERLDEGELEALLAHIMGFENGMIDEIYLVHKRISASLGASCVIVRFVKDCVREERERIMHKIFNYLHTVSSRQYSLHEFNEVPKRKVAAVPNSLVYKKKRDNKGE